MKTINLICLFIFYILSISPHLTFAQNNLVVRASGYGTILENDVAAARDLAIQDAMRKAVEQNLGSFLSSETIVQNYTIVQDNIVTWSRGYVKKYELINEKKLDESTYEVTISTILDKENLSSDALDLQNLVAQVGNPRFMVMIQEKNIGLNRTIFDHYFEVDITASENSIIDVLTKEGLQFIDPSVIRNRLEKEKALAILQGDNKAAIAAANAYGAEIAILGKAVAKVATGVDLGGMKSCQADVTARAVYTDTGEILATASNHAAKPHIDELTGGTVAIKFASEKVAKELVNKILKYWQEQFYQATTIEVTVENLLDYEELNQFKTNLKYSVRGIKEIHDRKFQNKQAVLEIKITGNTNQFTREITYKKLGNFDFEITEITHKTVRISIE